MPLQRAAAPGSARAHPPADGDRYTSLLMVSGALLGLFAIMLAPAPPERDSEGLVRTDLRKVALSRVPLRPFAPPLARQPQLAFRFGPVGAISGQVALDPQQRIYFTSDDGHLYAVTPQGRLRFARPLGGIALGGPVLMPEGPCAGSSAGELHCFSWDGAPRYRVKLGAAIEDAPLRAADGNLYVSAGADLWRVTPPSAVDSEVQGERAPLRLLHAQNKLAARPVQDVAGRLFVASHDHHIYALTSAGTLLWRTRTDTAFDSPLSLSAQGELIAAGNQGHIYKLRTTDGAVLAERTFAGHLRGQPQPIAGRLWIQTFGPRPALLSLHPENLAIELQAYFPLCDTPEQGSASSPTLDPQGLLWLGGPDDAIYAFDHAARLQYRAPVGGRVMAQPVVNRAGVVLVGAEDGYLYGLRAPRGNRHQRLPNHRPSSPPESRRPDPPGG